MLLLNLKPSYKSPGDANVDETEPASFQESGFAKKDCTTIVKEEVCVQADVKIIPKVTVGRISTFCGDAKIGKCDCGSCSDKPIVFSVSRNLCVQIPLEFSVEAAVRSAGHVCGEPDFEPCRLCET